MDIVSSSSVKIISSPPSPSRSSPSFDMSSLLSVDGGAVDNGIGDGLEPVGARGRAVRGGRGRPFPI